jgi:peptidoglycan/LPS O-acetylase OafA/YrhL
MPAPPPPAANSADHLPELDGWRGLAILLVLLAHFGGLGPFGLLGVQLFFVLSGLLMARILFEQRMPLASFYRRRIARIAPALALYLGTLAVLTTLWPVAATPSGSLAWSALFLRTYLPGSDIWADPLVGHLWSLNVEEHGYLLMSLIALGLAGRPHAPALALAMAAAACVLAFALYRAHPSWVAPGSSEPVLRTEVAAFAILAAAAMRVGTRGRRAAAPNGPTALAVVLALLAAMLMWLEAGLADRGGNLLRHFLVPLALAVLVNLVAQGAAPERLRWFLTLPWLRWLGLVSYSLYLWHYPLWRLGADATSPWVLPAACGASLCLAALSYHVVERPLRRWINGPPVPVPRSSPA